MDFRLLLSHHREDQAERCFTLPFGVHVCRRCSVLYPLVALVTLLQLLYRMVPLGIEPWLMAIAPLPATALFVAHHLGWRDRPWQVIWSSALLSLPLGVGLARYVVDPWDRLFWGMVVLYGVPALGALLLGAPAAKEPGAFPAESDFRDPEHE